VKEQAMVAVGSGKKLMSEINVTPLVDVMLVLLIIFMVTAPMMMEGVDVNLPQTKTKSIKTQEDPLILSVTKNGDVFLENHTVKLEDLGQKIETVFKYRKEKEVLLRADKDIPYGFVVKVMAEVKRAGVAKLGMVTEPLD
jgi:biopolymer transport protein TolR